MIRAPGQTRTAPEASAPHAVVAAPGSNAARDGLRGRSYAEQVQMLAPAVQLDAAPAAGGAAGGGAAAAGRSATPFPIEVDAPTPEFVLDHTKSKAEIAKLTTRGTGTNSGLTNATFKKGVAMHYDTDTTKDPPAFWVTKVAVRMMYANPTVYVAREYAKGSCEFDETWAHEQEHVQSYVAALQKSARTLRNGKPKAKWAKIPTASDPWRMPTIAAAEKVADVMVKGACRAVFDRWKQVTDTRDAELDSAESYGEVHGRCSDWGPEGDEAGHGHDHGTEANPDVD